MLPNKTVHLPFVSELTCFLLQECKRYSKVFVCSNALCGLTAIHVNFLPQDVEVFAHSASEECQKCSRNKDSLFIIKPVTVYCTNSGQYIFCFLL